MLATCWSPHHHVHSLPCGSVFLGVLWCCWRDLMGRAAGVTVKKRLCTAAAHRIERSRRCAVIKEGVVVCDWAGQVV